MSGFLGRFRERRALRQVRIETLAKEIVRLGQVVGGLQAEVAALSRRTLDDGAPNLHPAHVTMRETANIARNAKVFGTELAERRWAIVNKRNVPLAPVRVGLAGRLCRQGDIESAWLRYWLSQAQMAPIYHRKVWETGYILQALYETGLLREGTQALGFAVGHEPIPAVLAARGVQVLASDLQSDDPRAQVWAQTSQNAAELGPLARPNILPDDVFRARCGFRHIDMTQIPADLAGKFDIVWSSCSLEHLGSIEAGLRFIENAMACLRPGGIAVHTTELNISLGEETIDNWPTVLFRQRDIEACIARLREAGHQVAPVDYSTGDGVLDGYIDVPPYLPVDLLTTNAMTPHLRLSIDGFAATSIGLIIKAKA